MWGVHIVATEFPDSFMQLQLILNHPVGENVKKHHLGPEEAENDLVERGPWECQNGMQASKKVEPTQISN